MPKDILAPLDPIGKIEMWEGKGPVPRDVLVDSLAQCDGWLSMLTDRIDAEVLDFAPNLRVISQMSVGVDNIDVDECREREIEVGHTPDVLTETVADTAFALIAAALRRLPEGEHMVKSGQWGPWSPWHFLGNDIHGATLGIIGMGRIGQAVVRRAAGFNMSLIYTSTADKRVPHARRVALEELLGVSDVVLVAAPLTDDTRRMIGAAELAAIQPHAYLVNIARGPLVETNALVAALAAGTIGGVALDVTDPEPLPHDHPLLSFPNCLVVPHLGSASVQARRAMAALAVENLVAALTGKRMPAPFQ
jgi:glyoxylate reductase